MVPWVEPADLRHQSARGVVSTGMGVWGRFIIQFGTTIFLARALGPREYGIAGLVIVLGGAAELLKESGFAAVIGQRRELTVALQDAIAYFTVLIGTLLSLALAISGPWLAVIFGDDRYRLFAVLLAPTFLLAAISSVPQALLIRRFQFHKLAGCELAAVLVGCAVAIGAAVMGFGALALILQTLTYVALSSLLVTVVARWRPTVFAAPRALSPVVAFGTNLSIVKFLNYSSRNFDNLIVGALFGPVVTGLYIQAYQLFVLPLAQVGGPLQRVAIPTFRRVLDDRARFRRYYRAVLGVVALLLWPLFAIAGSYSASIVTVLFGDEWSGSAPLFSVLAVAGAVQAVSYVSAWVFVATEQVERQKWCVVLTQVVIFSSFAIGSRWGIQGLVSAYTIASALIVLPEFLALRRQAGLRSTDLAQALAIPVVAGLIALATAELVQQRFGEPQGILALVVHLMGVVLATGAVAWCAPAVRRHLRGLLSVFRPSPQPGKAQP